MRVAPPTRKTTLIEQYSLGCSLSRSYGLNFRQTHPVEFPDPSPIMPPVRLGSDVPDFNRHYAYFSECLGRLNGSIPVLLTERHFFSIPFLKALQEYAGRDIVTISLDDHLDGVNTGYTNWGFWGFGIRQGIMDPRALSIIGSSQIEQAEEFSREYMCDAAERLIALGDHEDSRGLLETSADAVAAANRGLRRENILADWRLRSYAEYCGLKNLGVSLDISFLDRDLAGVPLFVSFDSDITWDNGRLAALARKISAADILGVHISEMDVGVELHGAEGIENFVEALMRFDHSVAHE